MQEKSFFKSTIFLSHEPTLERKQVRIISTTVLLSISLSKNSFKLILIDSELILILGDTHGFSP